MDIPHLMIVASDNKMGVWFAVIGVGPDNLHMARVFVGIGSNVGDRAGYVRMARQLLDQVRCACLVQFSGVYETDPVGLLPQKKYLNAVAELDSTLEPVAMLNELVEIEAKAGRPPLSQRMKWGPRTLDLDILLYDQRVISGDGLIVPHPRMHDRWFVLRPLADLDPLVFHPLLQTTVGSLLKKLEQDTERVNGKYCNGRPVTSNKQVNCDTKY